MNGTSAYGIDDIWLPQGTPAPFEGILTTSQSYRKCNANEQKLKVCEVTLAEERKVNPAYHSSRVIEGLIVGFLIGTLVGLSVR